MQEHISAVRESTDDLDVTDRTANVEVLENSMNPSRPTFTGVEYCVYRLPEYAVIASAAWPSRIASR